MSIYFHKTVLQIITYIHKHAQKQEEFIDYVSLLLYFNIMKYVLSLFGTLHALKYENSMTIKRDTSVFFLFF